MIFFYEHIASHLILYLLSLSITENSCMSLNHRILCISLIRRIFMYLSQPQNIYVSLSITEFNVSLAHPQRLMNLSLLATAYYVSPSTTEYLCISLKHRIFMYLSQQHNFVYLSQPKNIYIQLSQSQNIYVSLSLSLNHIILCISCSTTEFYGSLSQPQKNIYFPQPHSFMYLYRPPNFMYSLNRRIFMYLPQPHNFVSQPHNFMYLSTTEYLCISLNCRILCISLNRKVFVYLSLNQKYLCIPLNRRIFTYRPPPQNFMYLYQPQNFSHRHSFQIKLGHVSN